MKNYTLKELLEMTCQAEIACVDAERECNRCTEKNQCYFLAEVKQALSGVTTKGVLNAKLMAEQIEEDG